MKTGFATLAKMKKSKIRRGVIEDVKKDDGWFKEIETHARLRVEREQAAGCERMPGAA